MHGQFVFNKMNFSYKQMNITLFTVNRIHTE